MYNNTFEVDAALSASQSKKIINYIKQHGSISTYEAYTSLGVTSLHRRLTDLRKKGYEFNKTAEKKVTVDEYGRKITKRFNRYTLA